jgi:hypothetical protein
VAANARLFAGAAGLGCPALGGRYQPERVLNESRPNHFFHPIQDSFCARCCGLVDLHHQFLILVRGLGRPIQIAVNHFVSIEDAYLLLMGCNPGFDLFDQHVNLCIKAGTIGARIAATSMLGVCS